MTMNLAPLGTWQPEELMGTSSMTAWTLSAFVSEEAQTWPQLGAGEAGIWYTVSIYSHKQRVRLEVGPPVQPCLKEKDFFLWL